MKLCIADPPYLGNARLLYSDTGRRLDSDKSALFNSAGRPSLAYRADHHPDAAVWDDPATHQRMVAELMADYDGWVIAMLPANLRHYLQWVPEDVRIAVWHCPDVKPTGQHPRRKWEAVLVQRPPGRRRVTDVALPVGDVLKIGHPKRFAGRKPLAWVEWVLGMMGYCPTHDTVDDLFHGSGAVAAALDQGRLINCKCYPSVTHDDGEP